MATKSSLTGEFATLTDFDYDAFDRTSSIEIGDVETSFVYACDDDRVVKTSQNTVTESILDSGNISADLVGNTVKVYTLDNSVYCENGAFTYNIINAKGDLVSTAGSSSVDYKYNAYGEKLESANDNNPIGYRNYYYDSETGLYYLKARYYDSTTGQFTQEDTVQDDNLQYNLYGYCSGNPVFYIDPSGHDAIWLNDYDGASYFGHAGLLLQNKNKVWWHFYWGNKKVEFKKLGTFNLTTLKDINSKLHEKNIYGSMENRVVRWEIDNAGRRHGVKKTVLNGYESHRYFTGDFTKSFKRADNVTNTFKELRRIYSITNNPYYHLTKRNCLQESADIMSKSPSKYQKKFIDIKNNWVIPNNAIGRILSWK